MDLLTSRGEMSQSPQRAAPPLTSAEEEWEEEWEEGGRGCEEVVGGGSGVAAPGNTGYHRGRLTSPG